MSPHLSLIWVYRTTLGIAPYFTWLKIAAEGTHMLVNVWGLVHVVSMSSQHFGDLIVRGKKWSHSGQRKKSTAMHTSFGNTLVRWLYTVTVTHVIESMAQYWHQETLCGQSIWPSTIQVFFFFYIFLFFVLFCNKCIYAGNWMHTHTCTARIHACALYVVIYPQHFWKSRVSNLHCLSCTCLCQCVNPHPHVSPSLIRSFSVYCWLLSAKPTQNHVLVPILYFLYH